MSVSTKPLVLYTVPTPNGVPISLFLEDLKAINPIVDYEWACKVTHKLWLTSVVSVEKINLQNNTQKVHFILWQLARLHSRCWTSVLTGTLVHQDESQRSNPRPRWSLPWKFLRIRVICHSAISCAAPRQRNVFWFDSEKDPNDYREMLQWLFFSVRLSRWSWRKV